MQNKKTVILTVSRDSINEQSNKSVKTQQQVLQTNYCAKATNKNEMFKWQVNCKIKTHSKHCNKVLIYKYEHFTNKPEPTQTTTTLYLNEQIEL